MELRNGKFYKGEELVPLEFGNKVQIRLMREREKLVEQLAEGLPVEVGYEAKGYDARVIFNCPKCGKHVEQEHDVDEEGDIKPFLKRVASCFYCKTEFVFKRGEETPLTVFLK